MKRPGGAGVARALMALFRGLTLLTAWDGTFDPAPTAKSIEDMVRGALSPQGPEHNAARAAHMEEGQ